MRAAYPPHPWEDSLSSILQSRAVSAMPPPYFSFTAFPSGDFSSAKKEEAPNQQPLLYFLSNARTEVKILFLMRAMRFYHLLGNPKQSPSDRRAIASQSSSFVTPAPSWLLAISRHWVQCSACTKHVTAWACKFWTFPITKTKNNLIYYSTTSTAKWSWNMKLF